jgi:hypothetical protein
MRTIRLLLSLLMLAIPATAFAQIGVSIAVGPPALPVYEQPICPGDGYLWTPGYWAYDDSVSDYYWVPGTWIQPPEVGFLWTPGYWGWRGGGYFFNEGYWGENVGFYGGINYGFGYWGGGYGGGRWDHGHFFYNRSVNNIDVVNIHNVYNERVENSNDNRVSFNGGKGGVEARPTSKQESAESQRHIPAVAAQTEHAQAARANPEQRASVNHGTPPVATTARQESDNGREAAKPADRPSEKTPEQTAVHPNDLSPIEHPAPTNSGNARADRKYEKQQDKLIANQNEEREKLQQKQDSEHTQLAKHKASDTRTQQVEQKHQQQTQELSQKHAAQQQAMQSHQPKTKEQKDEERPR